MKQQNVDGVYLTEIHMTKGYHMFTPRRKHLISALLILAGIANGAEFHLSPSGDDTNPGTTAKPLRTLAAVISKVRPLAGKEPITVTAHAGTYYLNESIVFTAADSGTKDAPITYVGDGDAVISGGRVLSSLVWKPYQNGIMQAEVPAGLVADQLFVNGQSLPMARYPNWIPFKPGVCFNGSAADAISPERVAKWSNPTGGIVHAMHGSMWGDMSWTITGKDAKGALTMIGGWQNNRSSPMHKQYRMVENIFEELDAPGEWYLNGKTNTLYLFPPTGTDLTTAKIEVATLRTLIEWRGSMEKPVRFVSVRGLTFRHAVRTFMDNKEPLTRSDWTICRSGALLFSGAENCAVEDSYLDQLGGSAIFVNGYNRRISIRRCEIDRAGTNAVAFVGETKAVRSPLLNYGKMLPVDQLDLTPGPQTDDYPADCIVDDCLLTRFAQTEKQSTGVQIQMARRITVRHCSIYDCPRAAINIGDGCWGGHVIEYCDVFDTVKETGDHGNFNSWGRDRFWVPSVSEINKRVATKPELPLLDCVDTTIIRNSRWRYDHSHGWDIDLDDGSSNYLIENNLCLSKGIKLREGFKRTVRNNICINNGLHPHVWPEKSGDIITGNIFSSYSPVGMPKIWGELVDRNLITNQKTLAHQQSNGRDLNSLNGDPKFIDPEHGDYRVADDSPALKIGFKNFPMDQFGVTTPRLKAKAKTALDKPDFSSEKPTIIDASPRTWLGATIKNISEFGEVSAAGLSGIVGVTFLKIPANSPAAQVGFIERDVVIGINGKTVNTITELSKALSTTSGPVTLRVRRNQADGDRVIPGPVALPAP